MQRKRSTDLAHGALLEQKEHVIVRQLSCILNVAHAELMLTCMVIPKMPISIKACIWNGKENVS